MKSLINALLIIISVSAFSVNAQIQQCEPWGEWSEFKNHFMSPEGRIIDLGSEKKITSSEGQSYGLFFALVANDKATFDLILDWTQGHLSEGDLSTRLPAWLWGEGKNKTGQILDSNPASDSDLWIAYSLSQAAQLWGDRRYAVLASVLAQRIIREETTYIPKLGLTLLPAPSGFELDGQQFKLNPSYSPLFIYKQFSQLYPHSPWDKLHSNSAKLILQTSTNNVTPDWVYYDAKKGFYFDEIETDLGSFNAIRTYLWVAMMAQDAPFKKELVEQFTPFIEKIVNLGYVPLNTYAASGEVEGKGPIGFNSALLPLLALNKEQDTLNILQDTLKTNNQLLKTRYYDSVLHLFGTSTLNKRFTINAQGKLQPMWSTECR